MPTLLPGARGGSAPVGAYHGSMGEADNVDLEEVRRNFEAIGERDWEGAQTLLHPDIAWHDPPEVPDAAVHRGREAVRRYWEEELFDSWSNWHLELEEIVRAADHILAVVRLHATARHTGIEQNIELFQVFTYRDGLVVEQRAFFDRGQALDAAGIDPPSS